MPCKFHQWIQCLVANTLRCAIGAAYEGRYHQSFITFPKPLAEFFAQRSRIFLEFEFDSPCVSTVQALLLLSSHEAANGRDARMWLYGGESLDMPELNSADHTRNGNATVFRSRSPCRWRAICTTRRADSWGGRSTTKDFLELQRCQSVSSTNGYASQD